MNDERRETAMKISRAISVVDADIRLSGKGHSWGSCSECAEIARQLRGEPKYILKTKRPSGGGAALSKSSVPLDTKLNPNVPIEKQQEGRAP